jgi:hypothetical protein
VKKIIAVIIISSVFIGLAQLPAAEIWESEDDFSSPQNSAERWKKVADHPTKGRASIVGGKVVYSATGDANDAAWAWGKKPFLIPTSASWQLRCFVQLPQTAPAGVNFTKGGMFIASPSVGKGAYRALTFKSYQRYNSGNGTADGSPYGDADTDYSRGGEREERLNLDLSYNTLGLAFRHNALTQTDTYRLFDVSLENVLAEEEFQTELAVEPYVAVGIIIAGKPQWSGTDLTLDTWSVAAFDPGSISLPSITKAGTTIAGAAWTLTISNLRLEKVPRGGSFAPKATAILAFGSTTLSIPVTGSIQKNGTFLLTGKGSASAKGYGFSLVYDTHNSVRITGKTSVTAPKQKAIKF